MPNDHPAFRAGEHVKFADLEALCELQAKFGPDGSQGHKWIHDLLAADFTQHPGAYVRIKSVSIYHFGTVLYDFDEVEGFWLEPSIVDRSLEEPSGHEIDLPASQFYRVTTDVGFDQSGVVRIQGIRDQFIYCTVHKNHAGREAESIAEVSRLRSKANFEARYGFDGRYDTDVSNEPGEQDVDLNT
jgi:hypothetical protein